MVLGSLSLALASSRPLKTLSQINWVIIDSFTIRMFFVLFAISVFYIWITHLYKNQLQSGENHFPKTILVAKGDINICSSLFILSNLIT